MNYVRNSVKAVVDAFNGSVDFYVFDPDDPLIRVWDRAFPGVLKPRDEMPPELLDHIRYPEDFLLTQGLVYAKYHMNDPAVFYNQEDLWVRATEKYYGTVQPVEPYYVMWKPPGAEKNSGGDTNAASDANDGADRHGSEFIRMLPFTPKNRQVLIGWIAGMCDPGNYGRLLAYRFPKEKRVLGTQQVETKIDQDSGSGSTVAACPCSKATERGRAVAVRHDWQLGHSQAVRPLTLSVSSGRPHLGHSPSLCRWGSR